MADGDTVAVAVELRSGCDPIAGALRIDGGPVKPFRGWLQLTLLLQAATGATDGSAWAADAETPDA
ncbi:MAG TPA: hypothetical protein VFN55_08680 [Solirubrobacteraceae bacterium]|nr:hypothetical protein [Solirubrobacteraceae bacterium]